MLRRPFFCIILVAAAIGQATLLPSADCVDIDLREHVPSDAGPSCLSTFDDFRHGPQATCTWLGYTSVQLNATGAPLHSCEHGRAVRCRNNGFWLDAADSRCSQGQQWCDAPGHAVCNISCCGALMSPPAPPSVVPASCVAVNLTNHVPGGACLSTYDDFRHGPHTMCQWLGYASAYIDQAAVGISSDAAAGALYACVDGVASRCRNNGEWLAAGHSRCERGENWCTAPWHAICMLTCCDRVATDPSAPPPSLPPPAPPWPPALLSPSPPPEAATSVVVVLRVAGDVTDFPDGIKQGIGARFAEEASVPPSAVTVTVTAASVDVTVQIRTASPVAAATVAAAIADRVDTPVAATSFLASVGYSVVVVQAIARPPTLIHHSPPSPPSPSPRLPPFRPVPSRDVSLALPAAGLATVCGLICFTHRLLRKLHAVNHGSTDLHRSPPISTDPGGELKGRTTHACGGHGGSGGDGGRKQWQADPFPASAAGASTSMHMHMYEAHAHADASTSSWPDDHGRGDHGRLAAPSAHLTAPCMAGPRVVAPPLACEASSSTAHARATPIPLVSAHPPSSMPASSAVSGSGVCDSAACGRPVRVTKREAGPGVWQEVPVAAVVGTVVDPVVVVPTEQSHRALEQRVHALEREIAEIRDLPRPAPGRGHSENSPAPTPDVTSPTQSV